MPARLRALLLLAAALWPARPPAAGLLTGEPRAFDGDTVRLADGRILRLAGIDAPEDGRPGAGDATRRAAAALAAGRPAVLQPGATDRYGRLLGDLGQGADSLSLELVAAGLAWVLEPRPGPLLAAQVRAVGERAGVHALDDTGAGPFVASATRVHHAGCRVLGAARRRLPWSVSALPLLASGRAPCRVCLRWPPVAPIGSRDPPPNGR